jgi:hypothetical protein
MNEECGKIIIQTHNITTTKPLNKNKMLRKLIEKWSCKHKWEIHNTTNIRDTEMPDIPTAVRRTLICKDCGKIKQINL